jgi:hypothetical protein
LEGDFDKVLWCDKTDWDFARDFVRICRYLLIVRVAFSRDFDHLGDKTQTLSIEKGLVCIKKSIERF